jgi:nodulation protein E
VTRVAITGVGIISAIGGGCEAALASLRSARSGIRLIRSIDASTLNCRIAGEVPEEAHAGRFKGFDRFARFALIAAEEAMQQAAPHDLDPHRFGVMIGTGLGGAETQDAAYKRLYQDGQTRLPPMSIPMSMYNAASSAVSTHFGAKGIAYSIVSACASSAHAIGAAFDAIRNGHADAMLAGGADAPIAHGIIRGWESLRVLAIDNENPERACRPFSADRAGLVLAEGAAVLVLERFDRARNPIGEIVGFGMTSDAGHITDPSADGAARAMKLALAGDIGYINAHGTGTRANDVTETAAIKEAVGDRVPVSSTKSMHGHAMGASGAIEIACSLLALNDGFLPPTINLVTPDPACDLDYVPLQARPARVAAFLSNSFGFGGANAVVAIRTIHGL